MKAYNLFARPSSFRPLERGKNSGFTVIELLFVTVVIALLAAIAIPTYFNLIQKAKETAVFSYISKLKKAEEIYRLQSVSGAAYTGDFDELETTGLIPPSMGANTRVEHDYTFSISAGVDGNNLPFWSLTANPVAASPTAKYFYADNNAGIRYATGAPANASSPPFSP